MAPSARRLIDYAFETLTEIYNNDLDMGHAVATEYHCDPDSSIQYSTFLEKHLEKPSTLKKRAIEIAVNLWMCTSDLHKLAKDQRDELDDLRKQLLESQQTVIELQKQKLHEKSETVSEMKEVVKAELKTYSSVTGEGSYSVPAASSAQLRKVVKTTVEEEERSRNVVVFGLSEDNESVEKTEQLVAEVCEQLGEKPRVLSCSRIGLKREGATRPILVNLATATSAQQLLYRAKGLRDWEKYGKVYIGPDRTREERVDRKGLVEKLKKRREEEPGKSFIIKGNDVILKS